jgi:hypothetical protein
VALLHVVPSLDPGSREAPVTVLLLVTMGREIHWSFKLSLSHLGFYLIGQSKSHGHAWDEKVYLDVQG